MSEEKKNQTVYTIERKGHSLTLHILLCLVGIGLFTIPYLSVSKRHYWHL